jgi:Tfp pilus assembly protein PilZ
VIVMLAQAEVGRTRRGRKLARQITKQDGGYRGAASKVIVMDNGRTSALHGQVDRAANGTNPVSVTFWMPDGSCYEGMTRYVGGKVMFIESKRVVPVGTEVTIRLTAPNDVSAEWDVAEGVVVWACPTGDQFQNGEGFGVSLQGCWPQQPGGTETEGSTKGAA